MLEGVNVDANETHVFEIAKTEEMTLTIHKKKTIKKVPSKMFDQTEMPQ
jgi:hypothetical protein